MRNFILLSFTFSIFSISCTTPETKTPKTIKSIQEKSKSETSLPKPIPNFETELPTSYAMLTKVAGDLDNDGIDENVLVVNTGEEGDFGEERVLLIFKVENGEWKLWNRSAGAILPSQHGGMMGDPFETIAIENGVIVINHFGGSRQKWEYTHRFRFQNQRWELIGLTILNLDPCMEEANFDYNLSTGNVVYSKSKLVCKNGENPKISKVIAKENFNYKMKNLPSMDGFEFGKIQVISPKGKKYP